MAVNFRFAAMLSLSFVRGDIFLQVRMLFHYGPGLVFRRFYNNKPKLEHFEDRIDLVESMYIFRILVVFGKFIFKCLKLNV